MSAVTSHCAIQQRRPVRSRFSTTATGNSSGPPKVAVRPDRVRSRETYGLPARTVSRPQAVSSGRIQSRRQDPHPRWRSRLCRWMRPQILEPRNARKRSKGRIDDGVDWSGAILSL